MIRRLYSPGLVIILAAAVSMPLTATAQVDAAAAEKIFKENDCHKCHHETKAKKGPSLKKISAKYKEKKLDEKEAIKHMTSGKKVKLDDGTEEDHKIIDTKDVNVQTSVAKWMLSH
ncbi:c-type cytochrome [Sulfurisoma sediminicola]|uniref:Cytochrome c n=1 Tax=Sulfurisoma sediminicola TaxID=1381557 RepID=A0A497XJT1_9PROT|nr:c-type cytochrome [Sulfurisoma sediminicola]RLJ67647.1 cytochrome c [Sulfurisoma sediminicola]